jgi:predicted permease
VGTKVHLRGYLFEVAGVARREFAGLGDIPQDFWVPLTSYTKLVEGRDDPGVSSVGQFRLIGRLKPDATLQQARAALNVWAHQKTADGPEADRVTGVRLWPRATSIPLDADSIGGFATILAAFALVLLIACANVANMMLARAMARQREMGIRLSLGAARSRLVRQLLTEGLLLGLSASAVGFFVAQATIDLGLRLMWATIPADFAKLMRVIPLAPDGRVFLFTLIAAGVSAIVFSLVPALHATRLGLVYAMRGDFSTVRRSRLRNGLIVSQVTVCVLLLISAGVLLRADRQIRTRDLGIDASHALVVQVQPKFRTQILDRLALEPAVETVGAAWRVPFLDGFCTVGVTPSGQTNHILAGTSTVSPEYFSILRISLVRGRNFTDEEAGARAPAVIISEATAQRFWPKQDALGRTLRIEFDPDDPRCKETASYPTARVIGIARNVSSGMASADAPNAPCLYFPMRARSAGETSLLIRVKGDGELARRNLDRMFAQVAPGAIDTMVPMQEVVAALIYPFRVGFWVSSFLGGLALVLTFSGIYGVVAYLVSQRTKEIGIRIALGATTRDVLRTIMAQSLKVAALGMAAGVVLALAVSRMLASVLVVVNTFDFLGYIGGVALAAAAAAAASYLPARRAAPVDPATTLRFE